MLLSPPPYSLDTPAFRFRALATLAGRAALGGEREMALAALVAARLVAGVLPPDALPAALRATRAQAARAWLAALALPAGPRGAFGRLLDATAGEATAPLADALDKARDAAAKALDAASLAELGALARAVREGAGAAPKK